MKKRIGLLGMLLIGASLLPGCGQLSAAPSVPSAVPSITISRPPGTTAPSSSAIASAPVQTNISANSPKLGGTLKIVYDGLPPISIGYPPELNSDAASISQLCVESLLREDPKGKMVPWLASNYKVADDLKSITFILNRGIKFHDGSDFNAQVAKWNLDNQITSRAQPYWASVDVVDDYTVRVNFKEWRNTLLRTFGDSSGGWMISKAAFDKYGLEGIRQTPVGTGPFKFVSFSRDSSFKTMRNENYWIPGLPYLDSVEVFFAPDSASQTSLMQGGADMILFENGKQAADFKGMGLSVKFSPVSMVGLTPDTANLDSPLAKQAVREATEYALNKELYAKDLSYGYWGAAYQIPASATAPYNPDFKLGRRYNLDKAKKSLSEAGFAKGLDISIICGPGSLDRDLDTRIQSDLAAAGIRATLEHPEIPAWQTYNTKGWKNAWVLQTFTGFANYNFTLQYYWASTSLYNKSWLRTPEWNEAYGKSLVSQVSDVNLMRGVTDLMIQQASILPVVEAGRGWAFRSQVMNAGLLERGSSLYWKPEQTWINK